MSKDTDFAVIKIQELREIQDKLRVIQQMKNRNIIAGSHFICVQDLIDILEKHVSAAKNVSDSVLAKQ